MTLKTTDAPLIDARGMHCPWPVLRAAKALRTVGSIIIVADDPIAPAELASFAEERNLVIAKIGTPLGAGFSLSPKRTEV